MAGEGDRSNRSVRCRRPPTVVTSCTGAIRQHIYARHLKVTICNPPRHRTCRSGLHLTGWLGIESSSQGDPHRTNAERRRQQRTNRTLAKITKSPHRTRIPLRRPLTVRSILPSINIERTLNYGQAGSDVRRGGGGDTAGLGPQQDGSFLLTSG